MKILYDYQAFLIQTHGGVSRCFAEMIPFLSKGLDCKVAVKQSNNIYLKEKEIVENMEYDCLSVTKFLPSFSFRGKDRIGMILENNLKIPTSVNINKKYAIELLQLNDYDVFHPTFYDDYFLKHIGKHPWILTIHDMIPELFGTDKWQVEKKKKLASLASHIIAVSEHTKQDIINILKVPEAKISVVYHANSLYASLNCKYDKIPSDYFLFVGDRKSPYKNFNYFINEISDVLRKYRDINLICTGKPFSKDEINTFSKLDIASQIFHHYASDKELYYLYKGAIAFIYPSLYEGFGIPILEAFNAGCPVILSNASCFPEIANNGAIYFEQSDGSLRNVLYHLLNMPEGEQMELTKKAKERLSFFSWEKSAKQLQHIYSLYE
ncbi:glycosyltransferase family 4 protein [Bacteroides fragilis]|uniref:glycosyltransferase family 4 protein n=1 Tax=Bacteroides TaxID=816 RepID=UPI00202F9DF7|nr:MULTISPECIES: glycosyltransferase family 1 protein [Bacteroides]MCM0207721.1 glycosyltransferase family 4 protein [Bacteroides fragilis]MCM0303056.1 glycosyltransferase family 4 protein [Bacteroides fragilis]MCS2536786.1 glycosyltransferase family 4 protein [Bacteroides fragilis]MDV6203847.1 glycosyltransferase family 1 protein [Bacteroides hominis (ex Liu et al. 2022)]